MKIKDIYMACARNVMKENENKFTTAKQEMDLHKANRISTANARQRKITVVSIASNQHGLKVDEADQELRNRSVSTVRLEKVISEIQEFHTRTEMQLRKSVKKQAKELGWFLAIFVVYVMFGAFLFFYIEECSGAAVPNDGSVPNIKDIVKKPAHKNLTNTCATLYELFLNNTMLSDWNCSMDSLHKINRYTNACIDIVADSALPVVVVEKLTRKCEVNEFMLLKYAEFAIFTLLTIGYGNTTPSTVTGRMCLILYAVVGIPLAVTMYSVAGKLIVQIITLLVRMVHSRIYKMSKELTHIQLKTLGISIFFMVVILLIGCSVTTSKKMEQLDFLSSLYFWFVSLTTIGYGDIHFARNKHLSNPHLLILSAGNILFGLGMMAAIIEAFSLALEKKDLQMSTIIIDEEDFTENEVEMQARRPGKTFKRIDEHAFETNMSDLSRDLSRRSSDSESNPRSTRVNGVVNQNHVFDDEVLLTDSIHNVENGHVRWSVTKSGVMRK